MTIKVEINDCLKQFSQLKEVPDTVIKKAYRFFVDKTPIRSGNARRSTRLDDTTIVADYAYAERLDTGWSRQAPDGMSNATEQEIERLMEIEIKKVR